MVIAIDALDECDDRQMMGDFIDIVIRAFRDRRLPLRFFFTSRVEEHIQNKFEAAPAFAATYSLALQNFDADSDIRTFFQSHFSTIYEEKHRFMRYITLPWPSPSVFDDLVLRSAGSFIFAFTLVNFVNDGTDLPHRKLEAALQSHTGLDPLYSQVLQIAPRSPHFSRIINAVITVLEPLSIMDMSCLFQIETGDIIHALQGVQSILIVPENDELPVRPFHTSLRDFLNTSIRSKDFFINPSIRHLDIVMDCLAVMTVHSNDEFYKGRGLKFAARSWCHHLLMALEEDSSTDHFVSQCCAFMTNLTAFVSQSFDSWINCMIFQTRVGAALKDLDLVIQNAEVGVFILELKFYNMLAFLGMQLSSKHDTIHVQNQVFHAGMMFCCLFKRATPIYKFI